MLPVAVLAAVLSVAAIGCIQEQHGVNEYCVSNSECFTGKCVQSVCAAVNDPLPIPFPTVSAAPAPAPDAGGADAADGG